MDYSLIVISKFEPKTVKKLIGQIEVQMSEISRNYEILLVCPDEKTKESAISQDKLNKIKWIKDNEEGKPAALNLAFHEAKGKLLILIDGDVGLEDRALENLVSKFDQISRSRWEDSPLSSKKYSSADVLRGKDFGLISGRPVPINKPDNLFGFWAHFLTEAAHHERRQRYEKGFYLDGSGYLMAIKKEFAQPMPKNILVDDAYLSHQVWFQGKKIGYAPKAKVKVKFPTNLSDWITQKKRTLSGHLQLKKVLLMHDHQVIESSSFRLMRSFFQEAKGLRLALTYPNSLKEYFWILLLIVVRGYVWLIVFWERKILKKKYSGKWKRIESTK